MLEVDFSKLPEMDSCFKNIQFQVNKLYSFKIMRFQANTHCNSVKKRTVCQYLVHGDKTINSLEQVKKILKNDNNSNPSIIRSKTSKFTIKPSASFQVCMLYGTMLKNDRCNPYQTSLNMTHINCSIFDGEWNNGPKYCKIKWRTTSQDFEIRVNELNDNTTPQKSIENPNETSPTPIFGKLECKIKDEGYSLETFPYEEPFLIGDLNRRSEVSSVTYLLPIAFFILIVFILCFVEII